MSVLSLKDLADKNLLKDLKERRKIPVTKLMINDFVADYIENYFISMFEYRNFPASLPQEFAEKYFIYQGCVATADIPEEYNKGMYAGKTVFLSAQTAEDPDAYGLGSKVIITSANGYNNIVSFDKCAFGWNNSAHTSLREFIMLATAAISNAFLSLRSGVRYSKTHPIYKASDDKEIESLNKFWQDICDDKESLAITSENILEKAFAGALPASAASNVINLSDPDHNEKLQYLVDIIDSYIRIFMSLYGQCIQGNGKRAQQTVDEVNGQTSASFILPNDMLACRRRWLEDMKKKGYVSEDAEIDFSAAFKVEQIKYQNEADANADGNIDTEVIETAGETVEEVEDTETKEGADDGENNS